MTTKPIDTIREEIFNLKAKMDFAKKRVTNPKPTDVIESAKLIARYKALVWCVDVMEGRNYD